MPRSPSWRRARNIPSRSSSAATIARSWCSRPRRVCRRDWICIPASRSKCGLYKSAAVTDMAIDVKGLTKRFGSKLAVDHVDIAVPRGQVWGFLGPNGSGKTTTIRMLCGLLTADEGEGVCLGLNFRTQAEEIKRQVGYMTQRFSFWEDLSIRENLEFVARVYELKDGRKRVDQSLEKLGLKERQHQLAAHLSGGWKQRMALAACL